jgi:hypothetical protein
MLIGTTVGLAQSLDTLKHYAEERGYVYYRDPGITMQAARFDLPAPATLHTITVVLGGASNNGTALLHIYGHEGGLPAPGIEKDLIKPITIRKSRSGVEHCVIELKTLPRITSHQMFIAIDRLSPGVILLSDRVKKSPSCATGEEQFTFQALRTRNNHWQWGNYAFAITAAVEYDLRSSSKKILRNVTADVHLNDTGNIGRSIAWADVDNDSYLDLLVGGRLFHNAHGEGFEEIGRPKGLRGDAEAGAFIDANGDGVQDIVLLGEYFGGDTANALYIGDHDGGYTRHRVSIPRLANPTSISIADANSDGALDLFIGTSRSGSDGVSFGHLYLGSGKGDFSEGTSMLKGIETLKGGSYGSQWVDVDGDGDLDLFVAGDDLGGNRLWLRQADGAFTLVSDDELVAASADRVHAGCHWVDYDHDGRPDLLSPVRQSITSVRDDGARSGPLLRRVADAGYSESESEEIPYEEQRSGGAWGDVDNDGLPDFVLTTSCDCRYISLYRQDGRGAFVDKTYESGLARVSAGNDAIWADYDNDGRLDLASFVDGRITLWRNELAESNGYIDIELQGPHAVGAVVTIWDKGHSSTQALASGRGMLMQEAPRLHFGIPAGEEADSMSVRWSNGLTSIYRDLAPNALHKLREDGADRSASTAVGDLAAAPNPFSTAVTITYTLKSAQDVRLGIYMVDGTLVRELVNERQGAGRVAVSWKGDDATGEKVAQGTYIYRLVVDGRELSGKLVLVR